VLLMLLHHKSSVIKDGAIYLTYWCRLIYIIHTVFLCWPICWNLLFECLIPLQLCLRLKDHSFMWCISCVFLLQLLMLSVTTIISQAPPPPNKEKQEKYKLYS
jgi:hypothetical protein